MPTIREVIENRNCIGCGACAAVFPQSAAMRLSEEGNWQAKIIDDRDLNPELRIAGETLCPLSGGTPDETQIAAALYPDLPVDDRIGSFARNVVGHVEASDFRSLGGSGGMVTWLLETLLTRGEVDAVVHVHPEIDAGNDRLLFNFGMSHTADDIRRGAKSRYYPVQMADVISRLMRVEGRYVFVGVPCFIKAIRLLELEGHIPAGRVRYTVGLVCGHSKSRYFGEYLAWQKGARPQELASLDFRRKLPDRSASNYAFAFRRQGAVTEEVHPMKSVKGRDWGEGMFKNPACEYCDDVLAECADIAVGDAWIPGYVEDAAGTNVAVIRSRELNEIIAEAERQGVLLLTDVTPDVVAMSQAAGLRHRRRGLMHRLARRMNAGQWAPRKRVSPKLEASRSRRKVYDIRLQIAEQSSALFAVAREKGRLEEFEIAIEPIIANYRTALKGSAARRTAKYLLGLAKRGLG